MTEYRIEALGDAREVYYFEADSEEEAREAFETGAIGAPYLTECSTEIHRIEVER